MVHKISTGVFLCILWLLLSGNYNSALSLLLGLVSVNLALYLSIRMEIVDKEGHPIHLTLSAFKFFPWLLWKILLSNLQVCCLILNPKSKIKPVWKNVPCTQKSDLGKVIFANSITLTPGTVSMSVNTESISVHALSQSGIDSLNEGEMDRRVTRMVGES